MIKNAKTKLISKSIDIIIANNVARQAIGFESDYNEVYVISRTQQIKLKKAPKIKIAEDILKLIHQAFLQQQA